MKENKAMKPREEQKRRQLFEEARAWCLVHGVSDLSLDQVAVNAGISKRTLYRYFGARDAFIAGLVNFDGAAWRECFFDAIRERAIAPGQRLYVFFDMLAGCAVSPEFHGCLFARVLCADTPFGDEILHAARGQVEHVRRFLHDHARKAGVDSPKTFAASLLLPVTLLLGGAGRRVSEHPERQLVWLAEALLRYNGITRGKP